MDDNDVCPICCEELDMSDKQFYPCKCGYQVCMWCWHRIKESESGKCPACRTPYGDDPHEFSAVDMKEVIKANKEKAAAEKREKDRIRAQQAATAAAAGVGSLPGYTNGSGGGAGGTGGVNGVGGMHIGGGSDGDLALSMSVGSRGALDPPKDRNQLANMRVIRRNLVYAVGLPPSFATEDTLRKPEYFGQYGKISKIVLNRNHNGNGDPRRASASAYVTFTHKDDTLSCILALDGFYVDGRNIRASYGTSKYCSAFIKNVRCNNPDCTYLHVMGDADDTFTKQEIQAGYVTSGRDVLARQQQLAAASNGSASRRRVAGGGPSGTGKAPSNGVFPQPTYDEPVSTSTKTTLVPPPSSTTSVQFPPVGSVPVSRSTSTGGIAGFSSAVSSGGKITRSSSLGASVNVVSQHNSIGSTTAAAAVAAASTTTHATTVPKSNSSLTPAEMLSRQQEQLRKMHPQNNTGGKKKQSSNALSSNNISEKSIANTSSTVSTTTASTTTAATAASVVAGVHSISRSGSTPSSSLSTLTSLTPLKRSNSLHDKRDISTLQPGIKSVSSTTTNDSSSDAAIPVSSKGMKDSISNTTSTTRQKDNSMKLHSLRNGSATLNTTQSNVGTESNSSPTSSISSSSHTAAALKSSSNNNNENTAGTAPSSSGAIGGSIIGSHLSSSSIPLSSATAGGGGGRNTNDIGGQKVSGGLGNIGAVVLDNETGVGLLSGNKSTSNDFTSFGSAGSNSVIGGHAIGAFGGGTTNSNSSGAAIGGTTIGRQSSTSFDTRLDNSQWGGGSGLGSASGSSNDIFGQANSSGLNSLGGAGIWGDDGSALSNSQGGRSSGMPSGLQNNSIGSSRIGGDPSISSLQSDIAGSSLLGNQGGGGNGISGSSALASMLGIELPTGVGSLRDKLWESSTPVRTPSNDMKSNIPAPTPIGSGINSNDGVIIGGNSNSNNIPIGGYGSSPFNNTNNTGNTNTNDIALLQSLLPGVHITSGNAYQPAAPNQNMNNSYTSGSVGGGGWNSMTGMAPTNHHHQQQQQHQDTNNRVGVGGLLHPQHFQNQQQQQQPQRSGDTWGNAGFYSAAPSNQQSVNESQQQRNRSNIW